MDELDIISALRPDEPGPTERERAIAKERFMLTITHTGDDGRDPRAADPTAADPTAADPTAADPNGSEPTVALDPTLTKPSHRPGRWRRRWPAAVAAAVAVAATVAIVIGALTVFGPSGPLAPSPAGAAELHRLADLAGQSQYPPVPYSIVTRDHDVFTDPTGSDVRAPSSHDLTTYTLGKGNSVTDSGSCGGGAQSPLGSTGVGARPPAASADAQSPVGGVESPVGSADVQSPVGGVQSPLGAVQAPSPADAGAQPPGGQRVARSPLDQCGLAITGPFDDPELANAATVAAAHALLDQDVEATMDHRPGTSRTAATLQVVARALHTPTGTPAVRAELLRVLADSTSISIEPDVSTPLGATGSRFSADADWGTFQVVIDPIDGYLLETHTIDRQHQPGTDEATSFGRPQPASELPDRIRVARDALVANTAAIEADPAWQGFGPGQELCDVSTNLQADHVTPLPSGLGLTHCWTTPS